MTFTYTLGTPIDGGTIHMTQFGTERIDIVVIASGGSYLADDIQYCTTSPPLSIDTGASVTC